VDNPNRIHSSRLPFDAESLSVPDFVGVMDDVENDEIKTQGKVIDVITEDRGVLRLRRELVPGAIL
jgi:hypothetical protein